LLYYIWNGLVKGSFSLFGSIVFFFYFALIFSSFLLRRCANEGCHTPCMTPNFHFNCLTKSRIIPSITVYLNLSYFATESHSCAVDFVGGNVYWLKIEIYRVIFLKISLRYVLNKLFWIVKFHYSSSLYRRADCFVHRC
jgi:hypothetical protein